VYSSQRSTKSLANEKSVAWCSYLTGAHSGERLGRVRVGVFISEEAKVVRKYCSKGESLCAPLT